MQLSALLQDWLTLPETADREISRLVLDSRAVKAGDLFLATKGSVHDGRMFINAAIEQGAVAVLVEAESADAAMTFRDQVPLIPVVKLQQQVGLLAAKFYDHPAKKLYVFGVTGTNGKTSCTHFIAEILTQLGIKAGVIGTLGSGIYGDLSEPGLTTPDPVNLQALLKQMVDQGVKAVAMEVSSHSIDQGRVNGIPFNVGIFTNLTQDHLDYHGDMASYAAVKRRFFSDLPTEQLIINADDTEGAKWIEAFQHQKPVYAYSLKEKTQIHADNIQLSLQGIKAEVVTPWGQGELSMPLIGMFNLSNALAAFTALSLYGISFDKLLAAFHQLSPVAGRMQTLSGEGKPLVVVDYAHTPDALEKVLSALRAHTKGQLFCVFGCGGDRDPGKRPMMASIAEKWADKILVTNDNPRHEAPEAIAKQILQGFSHPERVLVELDRSLAIKNSIQWAEASDCVLIAGKGAERYQQVGDTKTPFDDVQEAKRVLGCDVTER